MSVCVNLKRRDRGGESGRNFKVLEKYAINAQMNSSSLTPLKSLIWGAGEKHAFIWPVLNCLFLPLSLAFLLLGMVLFLIKACNFTSFIFVLR